MDSLPAPGCVPDAILDYFEFSSEEVRRELQQIDVSKSGGPDEIHAHILKGAAAELALPLTHLFNASLHTGALPQDWTSANFTPLHKGGKKDLPGNYRPIALTSHVVKILERLIQKRLIHHIEASGSLIDQQHGFQKRRSTQRQLLVNINSWAMTLNPLSPIAPVCAQELGAR